MDLLKNVGRCLEVVAEFGHLTDAKPLDQLAALGHEILAARQPNLIIYLSLLDEPLKTFYVDQNAKAEGRDADEFHANDLSILRIDPHFSFQITGNFIFAGPMPSGLCFRLKGIDNRGHTAHGVPPQRRESRLENNVGEEKRVFGASGRIFLRLALVVSQLALDFLFLLLKIVLRDRFAVVADVQHENLIRRRRHVIRVGMLTSYRPTFVEGVNRALIGTGVLVEQSLDCLLMFGHARYQGVCVWERWLSGLGRRILSY